jgi:uncharacterized RDD family membrane protein YckC
MDSSSRRTGTSDPVDVIGRRIGAALVDIGILFFIFLSVGVLVGDTDTSDDGASVYLEGPGFIAFVAISLLYYFLPEASTGQTLGKRILGVRVEGLDGRPASTGAVAIRTLLRLVDSLPFLYLLGLLVALVTPRRQRIGDLAARTVVTRAPR